MSTLFLLNRGSPVRQLIKGQWMIMIDHSGLFIEPSAFAGFFTYIISVSLHNGLWNGYLHFHCTDEETEQEVTCSPGISSRAFPSCAVCMLSYLLVPPEEPAFHTADTPCLLVLWLKAHGKLSVDFVTSQAAWSCSNESQWSLLLEGTSSWSTPSSCENWPGRSTTI